MHKYHKNLLPLTFECFLLIFLKLKNIALDFQVRFPIHFRRLKPIIEHIYNGLQDFKVLNANGLNECI